MVESSLLTKELLGWGIGLAIGLPILVLVLGELSERLEQHGNPLAEGVRQIRHLVLPVLAVLLALRYVLGFAGSETWMRLIETLLWVTVAYAGLTLVRNLTQVGQLHPTVWVNKIPGLFFALARAVLIFYVISTVASGVWGADISKLTTWVGLGSAALALALQDTLSNLVSGFLLLADRPFRIGDWCRIDGTWLQVKQISWRTTRFEDANRGLVIIPNGSLGKRDIFNFGQAGTVYQWYLEVSFSYDDPPNVVTDMIKEVIAGMDNVIPDSCYVFVAGYTDHGITYWALFSIDFWEFSSSRTQFFVRIYYAAKRLGLTLARPVEYKGDLSDLMPKAAPPMIADMLRANALFESLPAETIDGLAVGTTLTLYSQGEVIVHQGEPDEGFYVIQTGEVTISVRDRGGHSQDIAQLKTGDFFGEMALLRNEPSPISAMAMTEVQVLVIDGHQITHLIETNPQFAREMNFFIEKRRTLISPVSDMANGMPNQNARQDWIDIAKKVPPFD